MLIAPLTSPQVCELDLCVELLALRKVPLPNSSHSIFNFSKAYAILDELILAGEMQESSKKSVLRAVRPSGLAWLDAVLICIAQVGQADQVEEAEASGGLAFREIGLSNRLTHHVAAHTVPSRTLLRNDTAVLRIKCTRVPTATPPYFSFFTSPFVVRCFVILSHIRQRLSQSPVRNN